ncbi:MAG: AEC family transporter [Calothrix sp. CSU_2_0]|nr:AEC family transporter [Calothrix sp. CSU_2_0]
MGDTLFHAYTPLILWTGLGLIIFRFLPKWFPKSLGRCLYWIGIPLELIALARQGESSEYPQVIGTSFLAPTITVVALTIGLLVSLLVLWLWKNSTSLLALNRTTEGSFLLAAVLGNTGFVGLAIAPSLVDTNALHLAVLFSVIHNIIGPFGVGVAIASYFSHSREQNKWWKILLNILTVPALWAFVIGNFTRQIQLPEAIESGLQQSIGFVIACAFLLTGIRLSQLQGWKSLKLAFFPAVLRVVIIPLLVGITTTYFFHLPSSSRLAMVLMSGMPSAFVGLILAEEYNLDRDLIASSILVSTILLLFVLPVWILLFG